MITRRSFLGTVAALAVSPVASKAAPVAAVDLSTCYFLACEGPFILTADGAKSMSLVFDRVRRDDGDTILELR